MDVWQKGQVTVGAFTAAAAAYTASYCMKSMGRNYCDADGVVKPPPFLRCSTRPGIGLPWLEKYHRDLTTGFVVENGDKKKIPRYYKKKLPEISETSALTVAAKMEAQRNDPNNAKKQHPDRRHAAEVMHKRRLELTRKRSL